jgi:predicted ABC-type ATPase
MTVDEHISPSRQPISDADMALLAEALEKDWKFNPHHVPSGEFGGQFTSAEGAYPPANPDAQETQGRYKRADGTYTEERQRLHKRIVDSFFVGKQAVEHPTSYMLGGGPGGGKTTLLQTGKLGIPDNAVMMANDLIKEQIPEYAKGTLKAWQVHEEAADVTKMVLKKVNTGSYNGILDGTGDGTLEKLNHNIELLHGTGPRQIVAHYVTVPTQLALDRAVTRERQTGRGIPPSAIKEAHIGVSKIFPDAVAAGTFDHVTLWDTEHTVETGPVKIAEGHGKSLTVHDPVRWQAFVDKGREKGYRYADKSPDSDDHEGSCWAPPADGDECGGLGTSQEDRRGSGGDGSTWDRGGYPIGMGDLKAAPGPALVRLAAQLEPSLKRRFLEAIDRLRSSISLEHLAEAIESNSLNAVQIQAKLSTFAEQFGELAVDLKAGFHVGSNIGLRTLAEQASVSLRYDVVNPLAVSYAQNHLAQLVQPLAQDAKEVIAEVIGRALAGELTSQSAAIEIRDTIGLDPRRYEALLNYRDLLVELGDIDIEKKLNRYQRTLLKARSETIARTEIMRAANQGQRASWQEAVRQGLLRPADWQRVWYTVMDERLCETCGPMHEEAVGFDDEFMGGDPPKHPNCRCTVKLGRAVKAFEKYNPNHVPSGEDGGQFTFADRPSGGPTQDLDEGKFAPVSAGWAKANLKPKRKLTEQEQAALAGYSTLGSDVINTRLREGKGKLIPGAWEVPDPRDQSDSDEQAEIVMEMTKSVPAIDRAIATATVPKDIVTYRAEAHAPPKGVTVGATFKDYGYTSTSVNKGRADNSREIIVEIPKGTHALALESIKGVGINDEEEILLPRGTRFQVTKVTPKSWTVRVLK